MAWPFAIPYVAPIVSEGLGALGVTLASLGIIKNKDAIKDAVTEVVTDTKNRVGTKIGNIARSTFPGRAPITAYENPVKQPTDAIRTTVPIKYTKLASYLANEAPATTEGSNTSSTDSESNSLSASQPAPTTSGSQTTGENTAGSSDLNNTQNNDLNKRPRRPFFGKKTGEIISKYKPFGGYGEGPIIKDVGRFLLRDAPIVEGGLDAIMNIGGIGAENDTILYVPSAPFLKYGNPYGWVYSIGEKTHTRPVPNRPANTSTVDDSLRTEKLVVITPTLQPDSSAIYKFSDL